MEGEFLGAKISQNLNLTKRSVYANFYPKDFATTRYEKKDFA